MANINTNVDKGPHNATNKATSKYLNNTTVNKKPASRMENIITLSIGFLSKIMPAAPININAIAIKDTKNSILTPQSKITSSSNLFKAYAIAFALIVEQIKNAAATISAKGVLITNAISADTPKPITFRYNNLSALFCVINALKATNIKIMPIISTYINITL